MKYRCSSRLSCFIKMKYGNSSKIAGTIWVTRNKNCKNPLPLKRNRENPYPARQASAN